MSATVGPRAAPYQRARARGRAATRPLATKVEAHLVLAAMTVLSLAMWIVVPFLWLHAAARLGGERPAFLTFAIVVAGLGLSVAVLAKALLRLDCLHCELSGRPLARMPRPWLQSYSEHRVPCERTALTTLMVACACGAVVAFLAWYVALDGRSIFA